MRRHFTFPHPVNEVAARVVAAGAVLLAVGYLVTGHVAVLVLLAYGFVARVLAGPRFSLLGRLATEVVVPRLAVEPRLVPGPPKRFAQGIGAAFTVSALIAHLAGVPGLAQILVGGLAIAASLEAAVAFCLGCQMFAVLMRAGVIPEEICLDCADISRRIGVSADTPT